MSSTSYFQNASNFTVKKITFNNYSLEGDALQYLHKHAATSAMHDSEERYPPPLCHPGTGEAVVSRIEGWYGFEIPPQKKIMWVHAPAGFGKTAVAGTVSNKFESRTDLGFNPVGATFFFWRASPERNSPARFIITIAYQLTMSIPELAPHIQSAVMRNPMILNKALEVQLIKLIVEPFKSLGELEDMPHRLIIVDGLDECINSDQESRVEKQYAEDQERVQVRILDLIYTLQSHRLPLCILILSRPEPWIKRHIESGSFQAVTEILDLYQVGDHLNDVEKYVRHELARIAESLDPQPTDDEQWPGADLLNHFLRKAGGHMLYATTVIRHIDTPYDDPRQRLEQALTSTFPSDLSLSTPFSSLHELYRQILRSCPQANRATMTDVLEELLATDTYFQSISQYHDPNGPRGALEILDRLSGRPLGRGFKAIRSLHGVIRLVDTPSHTSVNFFYHSSFLEFLQHHRSPLPDVTPNIMKGTRRVLAGCLQSLSTVTLDNRVDEGHVKFALWEWASLWIGWVPSCEDDLSSLLRAFLVIDLTACFLRGRKNTLYAVLNNLYDPSKNAVFHRKSFFSHAALAEEVLSYFRSSTERVVLDFLTPDYFLDRQYATKSWWVHWICIFLRHIYDYRPPTFDKIIRALKNLLKGETGAFEKLEKTLTDYLQQPGTGVTQREAVENIFNIVRQDDTL